MELPIYKAVPRESFRYVGFYLYAVTQVFCLRLPGSIYLGTEVVPINSSIWHFNCSDRL